MENVKNIRQISVVLEKNTKKENEFVGIFEGKIVFLANQKDYDLEEGLQVIVYEYVNAPSFSKAAFSEEKAIEEAKKQPAVVRKPAAKPAVVRKPTKTEAETRAEAIKALKEKIKIHKRFYLCPFEELNDFFEEVGDTWECMGEGSPIVANDGSIVVGLKKIVF